ncbi:hypothetical protein SAMN04487792_0727 [Lactobacillus bombicola]|uniref:Uncharacterized protein n=1 Tax=Lactobacillus bombicola TaxID=1505723 RepID=A0A1I1S443_9LACO|nr:hypothetical protein SAMN04487792_0727 [Lactobacillus bombicola]
MQVMISLFFKLANLGLNLTLRNLENCLVRTVARTKIYQNVTFNEILVVFTAV